MFNTGCACPACTRCVEYHHIIDNSVLVPLTSSLYVPGKLSDTEHVLVDVGTGYYVKKVRSYLPSAPVPLPALPPSIPILHISFFIFPSYSPLFTLPDLPSMNIIPYIDPITQSQL
jgi:hypothetical protein